MGKCICRKTTDADRKQGKIAARHASSKVRGKSLTSQVNCMGKWGSSYISYHSPMKVTKRGLDRLAKEIK